MSEYIEDLIEFLKENPNPSVEVVSTLVKGGISCFGPVPTLCGAGIHCHSDVYDEVIRIIRSNK